MLLVRGMQPQWPQCASHLQLMGTHACCFDKQAQHSPIHGTELAFPVQLEGHLYARHLVCGHVNQGCLAAVQLFVQIKVLQAPASRHASASARLQPGGPLSFSLYQSLSLSL